MLHGILSTRMLHETHIGNRDLEGHDRGTGSIIREKSRERGRQSAAQAPVFRELYSEKRVVAEERRSRIDATPLGRFQEAFLGAALANNYARPVIGYERDVAALGRREVEAFFQRHYGPRNLVITVVGDTMPEQVPSLALMVLPVTWPETW